MRFKSQLVKNKNSEFTLNFFLTPRKNTYDDVKIEKFTDFRFLKKVKILTKLSKTCENLQKKVRGDEVNMSNEMIEI